MELLSYAETRGRAKLTTPTEPAGKQQQAIAAKTNGSGLNEVVIISLPHF